MSKLIKVALLSVLLAVGLSASDFLSKVTNGAISDNSIGVKQLSDAEMKKVLGGYNFVRYSPLDFHGYFPSYAYIVTDNNGNLPSYSDTFVGNNKILVGKVRYVNNHKSYYIQVYNITTGTHYQYAGIAYNRIMKDFRSKI